MRIYVLSLTLVLSFTAVKAQIQQPDGPGAYLKMRWTKVATGMPPEWYASGEARLVAENVLISQKEMGGWAKNQPYHHPFSDSLKTYYLRTKNEEGGTFDNGATITELRFLAKVYDRLKDERYKEAFEKGIKYILTAQYDNGGWPQFFPVKGAKNERLLDKTVPYSMHITYNDNAMVNVMQFLKEIYSENEAFVSLKIDDLTRQKVKLAFDKGVGCILKTQIVMHGEPTVWCAQHDEKTFVPANARAYELASFSGSESAGIVLLLMNIDHPPAEIVSAVNGSAKWFAAHAIKGIKVERSMKEGKRDTYVAEDKNAPQIWARFYDLESEKPYFCDRDGIKRKTLAEIGDERRNGYSWYTYAPQRVLDIYPQWQKKWATKK